MTSRNRGYTSVRASKGTFNDNGKDTRHNRHDIPGADSAGPWYLRPSEGESEHGMAGTSAKGFTMGGPPR